MLTWDATLIDLGCNAPTLTHIYLFHYIILFIFTFIIIFYDPGWRKIHFGFHFAIQALYIVNIGCNGNRFGLKKLTIKYFS